MPDLVTCKTRLEWSWYPLSVAEYLRKEENGTMVDETRTVLLGWKDRRTGLQVVLSSYPFGWDRRNSWRSFLSRATR